MTISMKVIRQRQSNFQCMAEKHHNTGGHEHDSKFSDEIKALIVDGIGTDNLSLASEDNDTTGAVISSIDNNRKKAERQGLLRLNSKADRLVL